MNKKTFFITTPIYYPSGSLHIGHVYTTTLARTIANYKIKAGYDVKMLTGSDEHGQKIQEKAKEAKMSPQEYVDKVSSTFIELWEKLGIKYDYFSRTSNHEHVESVKKQFSELVDKGDIYKGKYSGLYSVSDEEFLTKTQAVEKDGKFYHPDSKHELVTIDEESYFFKMSQYQEWWKEYMKINKDFILPNKIVTELTNNFVNVGLEDLSVTRSTFDWGVHINEDKKHIVYVWLDALNNYITALGYKTSDESEYDKYWKNGDEIVHVVGKEITRFHGIYWPIILEATKQRQPTHILSHGWIITPEGKMSKSKGNVIDPIGLIDEFGAEAVKYYFSSQINIGQDAVFSREQFINVYNSDLSNNYGNLVTRTLAMYSQNFDQPIKLNELEDVDNQAIAKIKESFETYKIKLDEFQVNKGIGMAMELGRAMNGYIDETKPWLLKEDKKRLSTVLTILLNGIYAISSMISIAIPESAERVAKLLGFENLEFDDINNFDKFSNKIPKKASPIFIRFTY
ncbi:MAG: methionine--tRNA ligase [Mycoplasmataceae bacterium]|nr:methionine--tRNA ligase [Mycoplasmataceae bacterium]